jgi:1-acyl-sn-glycerol-3-phosphate acyltransferase
MFYYFALYVVRAVLWLRCSIKVEGLENIPIHGGGFLLANHATVLDPVIIGSVITKRKIRFMAKKELFKSWGMRTLISSLGAFPIDRESTDRAFILQVTRDLSEKQEIILIFGEGTRNRNKELALLPLKSGFAFLAKRARVPVIPMYVTGAASLFKPVFRPRVQVSFGKAMDIVEIRSAVQTMQQEMESLAIEHQQKIPRQLNTYK